MGGILREAEIRRLLRSIPTEKCSGQRLCRSRIPCSRGIGGRPARGIFPAPFHGIFLALSTASGYRVSNPESILRLELSCEGLRRMQAPPGRFPFLSHHTKCLRADRNSIVTPGGVAAVRYCRTPPSDPADALRNHIF